MPKYVRMLPRTRKVISDASGCLTMDTTENWKVYVAYKIGSHFSASASWEYGPSVVRSCRKHTSELSHPRGKEAHSDSHQSLAEGFVCVLLYLRIKQKVFRKRSRCWEMEVRPACTETEGVGRVWTGPQKLLLHPTRRLCSSPPLFRESGWNGYPGCQSRALVIVWDQTIRSMLPTGCPDMMGPPKGCDIGP